MFSSLKFVVLVGKVFVWMAFFYCKWLFNFIFLMIEVNYVISYEKKDERMLVDLYQMLYLEV